MTTAREVAHRFTPRCTGGTGHGPSGDGPRWHSKRCDELTAAIKELLVAKRDTFVDMSRRVGGISVGNAIGRAIRAEEGR